MLSQILYNFVYDGKELIFHSKNNGVSLKVLKQNGYVIILKFICLSFSGKWTTEGKSRSRETS